MDKQKYKIVTSKRLEEMLNIKCGAQYTWFIWTLMVVLCSSKATRGT
jgi:hypothetical protein